MGIYLPTIHMLLWAESRAPPSREAPLVFGNASVGNAEGEKAVLMKRWKFFTLHHAVASFAVAIGRRTIVRGYKSFHTGVLI